MDKFWVHLAQLFWEVRSTCSSQNEEYGAGAPYIPGTPVPRLPQQLSHTAKHRTDYFTPIYQRHPRTNHFHALAKYPFCFAPFAPS